MRNMTKYCSPVEFKRALVAARLVFPTKIRASLHVYHTRNYADMRTFLGVCGWSGYAISQDGELINLFSLNRGRGGELIKDAVGNGAKHLNCYDGPLVAIYEKAGFKVIRREPYDPDMAEITLPYCPDVVFMEYVG